MSLILLKNGTVCDGTGRAPFRADVLIINDTIAAVGDNLTALYCQREKKENNGSLIAGAEQDEAGMYDAGKTEIPDTGETEIPDTGKPEPSDTGEPEIIDASGCMITPGFIDIHRHGDFACFGEDYGIAELRQGLTTVVNGNCGLSVTPSGTKYAAELLDYLTPVTGKYKPENCMDFTRSFASYMNSLNNRKEMRINEGMLAGSGTVRTSVAGYREELSHEEIERIRLEIKKCLDEGALGISVGLGYAPECFYTKEQLAEVLEPLKGTAYPLTVHLRSEAGELVKAVEEMIFIAKKLGIHLHISHLKAMGKKNHGRLITEVLSLIRREQKNGVKITFDVYPYTAGSTQLIHCLPHEYLSGGAEAIAERLADTAVRSELKERIENDDSFDNIIKLVGLENIYISSVTLQKNSNLSGKSLPQAAKERGYSDTLEFMFDLLCEEKCAVTMIDYITCEEDIELILKQPEVSVISDSIYADKSNMHPRVFGTFSRITEEYVNRRHVLSFAEAVRKMTSCPAEVMNLEDRGTIAPGYRADINIFRPEDIKSKATYSNPAEYSEGILHTLVNGAFAVKDGKITESFSGRVL